MRLKFTLALLAAPSVLFVLTAVAQTDGAQVYNKNCQQCHGPAGKGDGPVAQLIKDVTMPDFANQESMAKYSDDELFEVIAKGGKAVGKSKIMPPYKDKLDDAQIRTVINYVKAFYK